MCVLGIILDLFSADPVFSECRWFLIVCRCRCQCCRFHFVFLWIFPVENPCTIIHIEPSKKIRRNLKKKTLEIATWRVKRFFIFFFLYFVLCLCQSFFSLSLLLSMLVNSSRSVNQFKKYIWNVLTMVAAAHQNLNIEVHSSCVLIFNDCQCRNVCGLKFKCRSLSDEIGCKTERPTTKQMRESVYAYAFKIWSIYSYSKT